MNYADIDGARFRRIASVLPLALLATTCALDGKRFGGPPPRTERTPPPEEFRAASESWSSWIVAEMQQKKLGAVGVALVNSKGPIWEVGFGFEDAMKTRPANADTVFRAGSVSKVLTALATMAAVEAGKFVLDTPIARYVPDFEPRNDFGEEPTLRQVLCHRSGLCREPPRGSYFDPDPPALRETVESLNETELTYAPGARVKYSNAAYAVLGRALEEVQGRDFDSIVQDHILTPVGMGRSSFAWTAATLKLSTGVLWTVEGREFSAPKFLLGIGPAGNLMSTAHDLGLLTSAFLRDGAVNGGRLVSPETLRKMETPALDPNSPFGLGLTISFLDGHAAYGHGGAVYGFATEVKWIPSLDIGVVVWISVDCANAVATRIADGLLQSAIACQRHEPPADPARTYPIPASAARAAAGLYRSGENSARIREFEGRVYLEFGPTCVELRARSADVKDAGDWIVDDRIAFGTRVRCQEDGLSLGGETFVRQPLTPPTSPPKAWLDYIGEYGSDHNTLIVLERDGRLHALIEWFTAYSLLTADVDTFAFPDSGLYAGERLRFIRDSRGSVQSVVAANVLFPRRDPASQGKIRPVAPVKSLIAAACQATSPTEDGPRADSELIELTSLESSFTLDIRYATKDNFLGEAVYREPRAFLQRPAAEGLVKAQRYLRTLGYGIRVFDGYRPWWVTKVFWDATPEAQRIFVADPVKGSRHNRGCAVDLTLVNLQTGLAVPMTSLYDEGSPRAYPLYPGGTTEERWNRDVLRAAMEHEGFEVMPVEWWHFDYEDWRLYGIGNVDFGELTGGR